MRNEWRPGGHRGKLGRTATPILLTVVALSLAGCGDSSGSDRIDVVGHSGLEVAYEEYLEPGFQSTGSGEAAAFGNSFDEWEAQKEALEDGQSASVVQVPTATDMEELVEEGLVSRGWDQQPFRGVAHRSLVAIMVRKGNPLGIESFDDLLNERVEVLQPNPLSSDAGRWNVMAVYGSQLRAGGAEARALARTERLLEKSVAQPATNQAALDAFLDGGGDALIGYESEAIAAQKAGEDIEYVLPESTIMVESPIAPTNDAPPGALDFLDYTWTTAGQELWTMSGFRPVKVYALSAVQFPTPDDLFKISSLGGWEKVNRQFFDPETGAIAKFEQGLDVPTDG